MGMMMRTTSGATQTERMRLLAPSITVGISSFPRRRFGLRLTAIALSILVASMVNSRPNYHGSACTL